MRTSAIVLPYLNIFAILLAWQTELNVHPKEITFIQ